MYLCMKFFNYYFILYSVQKTKHRDHIINNYLKLGSVGTP